MNAPRSQDPKGRRRPYPPETPAPGITAACRSTPPSFLGLCHGRVLGVSYLRGVFAHTGFWVELSIAITRETGAPGTSFPQGIGCKAERKWPDCISFPRALSQEQTPSCGPLCLAGKRRVSPSHLAGCPVLPGLPRLQSPLPPAHQSLVGRRMPRARPWQRPAVVLPASEAGGETELWGHWYPFLLPPDISLGGHPGALLGLGAQGAPTTSCTCVGQAAGAAAEVQ